MAVAAGTRLGPYEILSPLGAGGMGEVYRARDTRLDRTVAVKVLPADALIRRQDSPCGGTAASSDERGRSASSAPGVENHIRLDERGRS